MRMNRVLIVDDEGMSREGLSSIFTRHQPVWSVAALFSDGQEALEYLQEGNQVDLIVTDIRMPKIGGLELIIKIRETDPKVPIIIVSGYAEFEYAKRAIDLRVYDYVLKPIKESEFHKIIMKIEKTLLVVQTAISDVNFLPEDKFYFSDLLFSDAIELNNPDYISRLEKIASVSLYHACLAVLDKKSNSDIFVLRSKLQAYLDGSAEHGMVLIFKQQMVCVIIEKIRLEDAKFLVSDMIQTLGPEHVLSAGIASCIESGHLSVAFSNSVCALRQNYYSTVPSVVCYCEMKPVNMPKSILDKLESDLMSVDSLNVRDDVFDLFDYVRRSTPDFNTLKNWVARLYGIILDFIQLHSIPAYIYEDVGVKMKFLYIYPTIQEIENELMSLLDTILIFKENLTKARTKRIVKQVQLYIQEHYKENISLTEIADVMKINYNYLSTIYKSVTNENMMDYLTNLRINKAKELLLTTKLKIMQISEQTGYSDPKYFIKRFRQMLGVTPNEYRQLYKI